MELFSNWKAILRQFRISSLKDLFYTIAFSLAIVTWYMIYKQPIVVTRIGTIINARVTQIIDNPNPANYTIYQFKPKGALADTLDSIAKLEDKIFEDKWKVKSSEDEAEEIERLPTFEKELKFFLRIPEMDHQTDPLMLKTDKFLFCPLYKNAYLPITALMCKRLTEKKPDLIMNFRELESKEFIKNMELQCLPYLKKSWWRNSTLWSQESGWTRLVVLRNPFDRFLAIWKENCFNQPVEVSVDRCYSCGSDIKCFLERQLERFKEHLSARKAFSLSENSADTAFYPQAWHCDLYKLRKNFTHLINFNKNTVGPKLRNLFRQVGWESAVNSGWSSIENVTGEADSFMYIQNRNHSFYSHYRDHSSFEVKSRFEEVITKEGLETADLIFRTYFVDFYKLRFKIPKLVRKACAEQLLSNYSVCKWK